MRTGAVILLICLLIIACIVRLNRLRDRHNGAVEEVPAAHICFFFSGNPLDMFAVSYLKRGETVGSGGVLTSGGSAGLGESRKAD